MSAGLGREWPTWLRDIDSLLAVHPHFILTGNVDDWYRVPGADGPTLVDGTAAALAAALRSSDFDTLLVHDVVDGYRVVGHVDEADAWARVQAVVGRDLRTHPGADLAQLAEVVRALGENRRQRLALVCAHASLLIARQESLEPAEVELFRVASKMARTAARVVVDGADRIVFNPVFWLAEREHELPAWYAAGNPGVRVVPIAFPGVDQRAQIAEHFLRNVADQDVRGAAAEMLAAGADGFGARAVCSMAQLMVDRHIEPSEPEEAVRIFRVGAAESPWRRGGVAARLRGGNGQPGAGEVLRSKVLGQDRAVAKTVDILVRAVMGLSGAQAANPANRPRGVLFFVGPTGTGKTEFAKSITELVFGTRDAYIRFDMSEFSAEHAGDRLIGAPPGYVGYDAGGELTNAVRQRPHSLLLFDEIEKAHPLILDKFLQILEDGRLTDSRGTTVHFSETLIVFTSNIGFYRVGPDGRTLVPNVRPDERYDELEQKIRREVDHYFASRNRPEIRNRIGDNVVVFDFIRPEVARRIAELQIGNVVARLRETNDITVTLARDAQEQLVSIATADLAFGGRGIGNVVESRFVNPLARALFTAGATPGSTLQVTEVVDGEHGPEVRLA